MGEDMAQVRVEWADWAGAEQAASIGLLPALEQGPVSDWWFIRKHPCWRVRYRGGPAARAHLDRVFQQLRAQGTVVDWTHGIYEPETWAFGGSASMSLAHQLFHRESRHLLHRAARSSDGKKGMGKLELATLLSSVFLRSAGLDWYEQGDVWARVAALRNRPAPFEHDPALARQIRTLMTVNPAPLIKAGPLQGEATWIRDLTETGIHLAELHHRGFLARGLRAVCAHHLIFSFNRWGLPHREQHILSNTARKIVMTDTTTPSTEAIIAARQALADQLRKGDHIQSPAVEAAFREVPRHVFIPNASLEDAYSDKVVSIKNDENGRSLSCASQPRIVAMMLEQARIGPGMRVLELGTGTGYNAALLAHLVGPDGHVVTIDVDQDLTDNATNRLKNAGASNVEVVLGDGALGHQAGGAPYDRIIATVGSHQIPAAWIRQLAPAGLLIAPVRIAGDVSRSIVFQRDGNHWISVDSQLSTFMPLRDSVDDDTRAYVPVTDDGTVTIQVNQEQNITREQVSGVLSEPATTVWTGTTVGGMEPRDGLWLRLALKLDNSISRMNAQRTAIDSGLVTPGLPWGDMAGVPTQGRGLAYLTSRPEPDQKNTWELGVIGHGQAAHQLADRMATEITHWDRDTDVSFELHLNGEETTLTPVWH